MVSRKPVTCVANVDPIHLAGRRLSCETIMFHQSVADRLGLNVTDHKCIDFLLLHGPCTAGELSQRSSLTTGAMTAVLDRLEKAGFVTREADPKDRRRVIVRPIYERLDEIGLLFADLSERVKKLASNYSEEELAVIIDFMNRSGEVLYEAAQHLRQQAAEVNQQTTSPSRLKAKRKTSTTSKRLRQD